MPNETIKLTQEKAEQVAALKVKQLFLSVT